MKSIFVTHRYADVSTGYLTKKDLELLSEKKCPCRFADYEEGAFFWVPSSAKDFVIRRDDLGRFGFSDQFLEIFSEAYKEGILYIRFDSDGEEINSRKFIPT